MKNITTGAPQNIGGGEYRNYTEIAMKPPTNEYFCPGEMFPIMPYNNENFWQLFGMYIFIIEVLVFIL